MRHVTCFSQEGVFAAWPANEGIWQWGNEILVGYNNLPWMKPSRLNKGHSCDMEIQANHALLRSEDGGETWQEEPMRFRYEDSFPDYSDEGFALKFKRENNQRGMSHFTRSMDKGYSWDEWEKMPSLGGLMARTDYLIKHGSIYAFLTASKPSMTEGKVICMEYGGANWELVCEIGECPGPGEGFRIMPASCFAKDGSALVAIRRKIGSDINNHWSIEIYQSADFKKWDLISVPIDEKGKSNPPTLTLLKDGRICLVFGFRHGPYGVATMISEDNGKTWGKRTILRDDFPDWDSGYCRSLQRPDGKMLTVYYVNRPEEKRSNIEATIWEP